MSSSLSLLKPLKRLLSLFCILICQAGFLLDWYPSRGFLVIQHLVSLFWLAVCCSLWVIGLLSFSLTLFSDLGIKSPRCGCTTLVGNCPGAFPMQDIYTYLSINPSRRTSPTSLQYLIYNASPSELINRVIHKCACL